jgi:hypothetical protein
VLALDDKDLVKSNDLRKNAIVFHPLLETSAHHIAKEHFVADVFLKLNELLSSCLLNPSENKLEVALEEGVKVRMLFACLRKGVRNSARSRNCSVVHAMKQIWLRKMAAAENVQAWAGLGVTVTDWTLKA